MISRLFDRKETAFKSKEQRPGPTSSSSARGAPYRKTMMQIRSFVPRVGILAVLLLTASSCVSISQNECSSADGKATVTKYLRFQAGNTVSYGLLEGDRVRQLDGDLFGDWKKTNKTHALQDVDILVPTTPTKVVSLAGNYRDHLGEEVERRHPEAFFKIPSCLLPHEGTVLLPTTNVHYEAELVIVIGKRARDVSVDKALDHVLGITCGNDISARDWQKADVQWWRAKASDTFGPCGPFIASGVDYNKLDMELRVDGEVRQKTNTKMQIHGVAETVSFLSEHITLEPGDLIYTGTPGQTQALRPGQVVEVEIEGVGTLRNEVAAKPGS